MTNKELHVVIGAGPLGHTVAHELVNKGKDVRVINRSGKAEVGEGVTVIAGDVSDVGAATEVCVDASVVYLCANAAYTAWPEQWPAIMHGTIEGAISAGAKLIFGDNLYMYGQVAGPIKEDLPYGAKSAKGLTRAILANTLMDVHHSGKLQVAIGRAPDFFGPRVTQSLLGERVFGNLLAKKPVNIVGNPNVPHSYMYIEDFARGLVTLGEREEALGEIWHIPCAETTTTKDFLEMIFEEAGANPGYKAISGHFLTMLGWFNPILKEMKEIRYITDEPFEVDYSKYQNMFGNDSTPHREAIRKTLTWYKAR